MTSVADVTTSPFANGILGSITEMVTGFSTEGLNGVSDAYQQLFSYVSVYAGFGMITMVIGLIAILVSPWIVKLMDGIR